MAKGISQEERILKYFEETVLETAEAILAVVRGTVKKRRLAEAEVVLPAKKKRKKRVVKAAPTEEAAA